LTHFQHPQETTLKNLTTPAKLHGLAFAGLMALTTSGALTHVHEFPTKPARILNGLGLLTENIR
jgi:hypothetical protein